MGTLLFLALLVAAGFVVGGLARLALPGPDPMPWWQTVLLGWAGSLVAGIVTWVLFGRAAGLLLWRPRRDDPARALPALRAAPPDRPGLALL